MNFKSIDGKVICVSKEEIADLSTDQLNLLKTCLAVQQGFTCIPFLQTAMSGNLSNSWSLIKANCIQRYNEWTNEDPFEYLLYETRLVRDIPVRKPGEPVWKPGWLFEIWKSRIEKLLYI